MLRYEHHQETYLRVIDAYLSLDDEKMEDTFVVLVFDVEAPAAPIDTLMSRLGISRATAYRRQNALLQWFDVTEG
jgi:hypothetical protein